MIIQWISLFLMALGCVVMFTASLALWRFDNVYMRLHASAKASTGGALSLLFGIILWTGLDPFSGKILILMVLIVFTGPILSHAIARAAHLESDESEEIPFEEYEAGKGGDVEVDEEDYIDKDIQEGEQGDN